MSSDKVEDLKVECENNLNGQLLDIRTIGEAERALEFCESDKCVLGGYSVYDNRYRWYSGAPFPVEMFANGDGMDGNQAYVMMYTNPLFADIGNDNYPGICRGIFFFFFF